MELSKFELLWIECALETELMDREIFWNDKAEAGKDCTQDEKDIKAINDLLKKVRLETSLRND